jgi:hypothetical protein
LGDFWEKAHHTKSRKYKAKRMKGNKGIRMAFGVAVLLA